MRTGRNSSQANARCHPEPFGFAQDELREGSRSFQPCTQNNRICFGFRVASRILIALISLWLGVAHAADNGGGTIVGSVRLVGQPPNIPSVSAEEDSEVCGSRAHPLQSLLVGTNQTVQNAVVYLGLATANGRPSTNGNGTVWLDQRDCEFVPRVQIARNSAILILKNSDPVLHVVQIESLNGTNRPQPLITVAAPYAGFQKKFSLTGFQEPTLLRAADRNGHTWMTAYIAVMPHPWAALTDEAGRFVIRGVPPGNHKIYVWHEVLGTLAREVNVRSDRTTQIDFEFPEKP